MKKTNPQKYEYQKALRFVESLIAKNKGINPTQARNSKLREGKEKESNIALNKQSRIIFGFIFINYTRYYSLNLSQT